MGCDGGDIEPPSVLEHSSLGLGIEQRFHGNSSAGFIVELCREHL
jgi:hypothetical protein